MLLLLPPSEGKRPGGEGPALGRRLGLSTPALAGTRVRLVAALRASIRSDRAAAAAGLRLPPGKAAAALAADRAVTTAATLPAVERYAGVVYEALDVASLPADARARAASDVVVLSGLWGVLRGGDPVPDYRVPAAAVVPGLGGVTAHWRRPLAAAMVDLVDGRPVLDLRSTDYAAMWAVPPRLSDQVVAVRVLAQRPDGRTAPVSFHAKSVKGLLARQVLLAGHADPGTALGEAADALRLRVLDTSTAGRRSVDLVGRYG